MNRKNFILLATTGAAALAIPAWYFKLRTPDYNTALAEPGMLSYIWDDATIRAIGESYRKQFPDENSKRKLINLLSDNPTATTEVLARAVDSQIHTDYENEDIVMLDGWMLSLTEARQCALYSFTISS